MSVDSLQDKIRKVKNPSVIVFDAFAHEIPPHILQQCTGLDAAVERFCTELLEGLQGVVGAVRFGFGSFALLGTEGVGVLNRCMEVARRQGYYILLDVPEVLSVQAAKNAVMVLRDAMNGFAYDGIVVNGYMGSDVIRPFAELCGEGKSLFVVVRTANKSAPELQDLLTGGRLVHTAAADIVSRLGEAFPGKCGYSQVGVMAAASTADGLRTLRSKYKRMFLLLDGYDYPNANAKNCSYAFDNLGHGAAACAGSSVVAAWQETESDGLDFVELSVAAAERMKKNLTRYFSVL